MNTASLDLNNFVIVIWNELEFVGPSTLLVKDNIPRNSILCYILLNTFVCCQFHPFCGANTLCPAFITKNCNFWMAVTNLKWMNRQPCFQPGYLEAYHSASCVHRYSKKPWCQAYFSHQYTSKFFCFKIAFCEFMCNNSAVVTSDYWFIDNNLFLQNILR